MNNKKGFSLIEMAVVMGITAILIGLAIFGINQTQISSRDSARKNKVEEIKSALDSMRVRNKELPGHFKWGDVSTTHIKIDNERIDLSGALQRTDPDFDLDLANHVETTNSTTDYCYYTDKSVYVVGVRLESGGYYYAINNNGYYNPNDAFYSSPEGGKDLRCIDGNL